MKIDMVFKCFNDNGEHTHGLTSLNRGERNALNELFELYSQCFLHDRFTGVSVKQKQEWALVYAQVKQFIFTSKQAKNKANLTKYSAMLQRYLAVSKNVGNKLVHAYNYYKVCQLLQNNKFWQLISPYMEHAKLVRLKQDFFANLAYAHYQTSVLIYLAEQLLPFIAYKIRQYQQELRQKHRKLEPAFYKKYKLYLDTLEEQIKQQQQLIIRSMATRVRIASSSGDIIHHLCSEIVTSIHVKPTDQVTNQKLELLVQFIKQPPRRDLSKFHLMKMWAYVQKSSINSFWLAVKHWASAGYAKAMELSIKDNDVQIVPVNVKPLLPKWVGWPRWLFIGRWIRSNFFKKYLYEFVSMNTNVDGFPKHVNNDPLAAYIHAKAAIKKMRRIVQRHQFVGIDKLFHRQTNQFFAVISQDVEHSWQQLIHHVTKLVASETQKIKHYDHDKFVNNNVQKVNEQTLFAIHDLQKLLVLVAQDLSSFANNGSHYKEFVAVKSQFYQALCLDKQLPQLTTINKSQLDYLLLRIHCLPNNKDYHVALKNKMNEYLEDFKGDNSHLQKLFTLIGEPVLIQSYAEKLLAYHLQRKNYQAILTQEFFHNNQKHLKAVFTKALADYVQKHAACHLDLMKIIMKFADKTLQQQYAMRLLRTSLHNPLFYQASRSEVETVLRCQNYHTLVARYGAENIAEVMQIITAFIANYSAQPNPTILSVIHDYFTDELRKQHNVTRLAQDVVNLCSRVDRKLAAEKYAKCLIKIFEQALSKRMLENAFMALLKIIEKNANNNLLLTILFDHVANKLVALAINKDPLKSLVIAKIRQDFLLQLPTFVSDKQSLLLGIEKASWALKPRLKKFADDIKEIIQGCEGITMELDRNLLLILPYLPATKKYQLKQILANGIKTMSATSPLRTLLSSIIAIIDKQTLTDHQRGLIEQYSVFKQCVNKLACACCYQDKGFNLNEKLINSIHGSKYFDEVYQQFWQHKLGCLITAGNESYAYQLATKLKLELPPLVKNDHVHYAKEVLFMGLHHKYQQKLFMTRAEVSSMVSLSLQLNVKQQWHAHTLEACAKLSAFMHNIMHRPTVNELINYCHLLAALKRDQQLLHKLVDKVMTHYHQAEHLSQHDKHYFRRVILEVGDNKQILQFIPMNNPANFNIVENAVKHVEEQEQLNVTRFAMS